MRASAVAELLRGVQGDAVDFPAFCKLLSSKFVSNQEAEQEILAAFRVRASCWPRPCAEPLVCRSLTSQGTAR